MTEQAVSHDNDNADTDNDKILEQQMLAKQADQELAAAGLYDDVIVNISQGQSQSQSQENKIIKIKNENVNEIKNVNDDSKSFSQEDVRKILGRYSPEEVDENLKQQRLNQEKLAAAGVCEDVDSSSSPSTFCLEEEEEQAEGEEDYDYNYYKQVNKGIRSPLLLNQELLNQEQENNTNTNSSSQTDSNLNSFEQQQLPQQQHNRSIPNPTNNGNGNGGNGNGNNGKGNGNGNGKDKTKSLIDELKEKYYFKTLKDSYPREEIWYYDDLTGNYSNNAEIIIKARLEEEFSNHNGNGDGDGEDIEELTNHACIEFLGHIQRSTYFDRSKFNPNIEWIASAECMINVRTSQTAPFSPDFLNTTYIPVKYSPEAQCPKIMKFLNDIVEPEDVELLLDFMAYCLWRDYKYNNWLLCVGEGQNGKSILLNLIHKFLGKHNTSSESLDRLLNEKFAIASLYQKLANIDADVSGDILIKNTGIIKKLTGNDESPGEFKYKNPFKFPNFAKLIASLNRIPETVDMTDAFFRRPIVINFTQQFFAEKDDPHILEKLCTEEEFSGLLNELLRRLPRIIEKGIRPTTNEAMKETYDKFQLGRNPVEFFKDKALTVIDAAGEKVTKVSMYDTYLNFCSAKKISPESEQSFSRKLKAMGFESKKFRKEGNLIWCWIDVKIKDWKAIEDKEQQTFEDIS